MGNADQIIADGDNLLGLIPQSFPMVMIDQLIISEEKLSKTRFQIREDNVFLEKGKLGEPGLIENIAQTAAAGIGYQYRSKNEPIPVGFIGAVQKLKIVKLPPVGAVIETTILETHSVINVSVIEGSISVDDSEIAHCEMKLFLKK